MTLRPMVLMVCGPCRRGDYTTEPVPGCVICEVLLLERADEPLRPARSRHEMVEAVAGCLTRGARAADGVDREHAQQILNAAIPGLLDGES